MLRQIIPAVLMLQASCAVPLASVVPAENALTPVVSMLTVRLAADNPVARTSFAGEPTKMLKFIALNAVVGNSAVTAVVTSLTLRRQGLAANSDIVSMQLKNQRGDVRCAFERDLPVDYNFKLDCTNFSILPDTDPQFDLVVITSRNVSREKTFSFELTAVELSDGGNVYGLPLPGNTFVFVPPELRSW